MSGRNQVGANVVDACDLKAFANQRVRDETFAEVTDPLCSPRIRFDGLPPSPVLSTAVGLSERTFRVTERRQDRLTSILDPNAASVHPLVRAVEGSSDSAPTIPRTPCSWRRPSQPRIARISRMLPIRVIRGQIRSFALGVGTVSTRATRPIRERRRNCHNVTSQQRH
jgi:hypothetical protein